MKKTISKVKRQPSEWEKIIANKTTGKECSTYHTIALISHASKVMLKFSKPGFSNM